MTRTTTNNTAHDHVIELVAGRIRDEGITLSQAAERAGLHRAEVWHWCRRRRNLRSDKLVKLLLSLNVRISG